MIELFYLASQIQCSANEGLLNIQVDVYHEQQLVQTMNLNDEALIAVDSVNDLEFQYRAIGENATCNLVTPSEMTLAPNGELPSMEGIYNQDSVQTLLSGLDDYEELFLVELGTTNSNSTAFDMQDVVFKVDNDPDDLADDPNVPAPIISFFAD